MPFGVSRGTIVDAAGNVLPGSWVEVRREAPGAPLAVPLYADALGGALLDNPFFCASGEFEYYAVGGWYREVYTRPGYSKTRRYVPVGNAQAADIDAYAQAGWTFAPESAIVTPPSAGSIRLNNADAALATHIFINKATLSNSSAVKYLQALSATGKTFPNRIKLALSDSRQLGWDVAAVSEQASWFDITIPPASYNGPAGPVSIGDSGFIAVSIETTGADGAMAGPSFIYSSTTSNADPGAGFFRLNSGTHASATAAYISTVEAVAGATVAAELDSWAASTNPTKGYLRQVKAADPKVWRLYKVTAVAGSTYRTVSIVHVASAGALANNDLCRLVFSQTGDAGGKGGDGPANSLSIGTVTQGTAAATITGPAPSQTLNLVLPKGDKGDPLVPRGAYASGTAYVPLDVVLDQGSSWVARVATTGNAPPTVPTTSNTYWMLLAQKGADGTGTGDMLASKNLSDLADKVIAKNNLGLSAVASTGAYADLSGKPTLGTAAAQNSIAFATAAQGATADTALQKAGGQTISGGFNLTPNNLGTISSGTLTPAPLPGNYAYLTRNGAFTLAVPATDCAMDLFVTNGASAGALTFAAGYKAAAGNTGDPLTTTSGAVFVISILRVNGVSTYLIKALQ
jgi:hypothetical protein